MPPGAGRLRAAGWRADQRRRTPASKVRETTEEIWRGAFDTVFLAGLRVCNAVLEAGTASDLAIAWVLSTSVKSPVSNLAASNGLRPGLAVLIKQLADEVGPAAPGSWA